MLWEIALDAVFLAPAEWRVRENDVYPVRLRVADIRPREGVVMAHEAGIFNAVQQHICDTKHVRELLFLDGSQCLLHPPLVVHFFHVTLAHVPNRAREESARTAAGV